MKQIEILPTEKDVVLDDKIRLHLPWPPTGNHYQKYRVMRPRKGGKPIVQTYLSKAAKEYYKNVWSIVVRAGANARWTTPVKITAVLHPPDRRKRDNSNLWKCIEDALAKAEVVMDDNQFVEHHDYRREVVKGGMVVVEMETLLD
jgi:crossover junction endodeoxyribonuclease RusA